MSLPVTVSTLKPARANADLLVIPLYADLTISQSVSLPLRRKILAQLRKLEFTCAWGTATVFPLAKGGRVPFVAIIGLGEKVAATTAHAEAMRRGMGHVIKDARRHSLRRLAIFLDTSTAAELAAAAVEGAELSNYRFTTYADHLQKEQSVRSLRQLAFLVSREFVPEVRQEITRAQKVLAGVALARDLVNQPASAVSPSYLVTKAREIAASSPRISVKILDQAQAQAEGFSAFLAVARGSTEEPYVIHLIYTPPQPASKKVFLVGKGVTFDSGGLSLKPADMMEVMKADMAGAAVVLGLFAVLDTLQPAVELHGIIATCENMPSGTAYRPGDILRAKNGKTIEVLNTDAEGRITLADALSYAVEHQPNAIIDVATLTGACMVALGETIAGLWSNDEALQTELLQAAQASGEGLCALPLPAEYKSLIKSQVADLRNLSASRYGGAITAAMFLREFVGETPWAHLDIAGPSYIDRPCISYYPGGATGYGVRLLAEYVQNLTIATT
ncbi:MAG: leucyl aminopeptidase [Candidatus Andersenbacteria bacterium]